MTKELAVQELTERMDYSSCSTLPSLGGRNAGYDGLIVRKAKSVL